MNIDLPIPVIGSLLATEFDSTVYYPDQKVFIHMDYMKTSEGEDPSDCIGSFKLTPVIDPESIEWLSEFNFHPDGQPKEYLFFNFDADDISSYEHAADILSKVLRYIYDNPNTIDKDIPVAFKIIPDDDMGQVMSDV